jgi:hypothetical protein
VSCGCNFSFHFAEVQVSQRFAPPCTSFGPLALVFAS